MNAKQFLRVYTYHLIVWIVLVLLALGAFYAKTLISSPVVPVHEDKPLPLPSKSTVTPDPLAVGPSGAITPRTPLPTAPATQPPVPSPVLSVGVGNNATLIIEDTSYELAILAHTSAYDLMKQAHARGYITFEAKEFSGMGFFIQSINGISNDNKKGMYWIYYINNKKASLGVSSYEVQPGDSITWHYEKTYN